ncbi:DUF1800 domain-containing protein [Saccharobesus litoralis]|uniref:DUF1800 domain-containing protein n=1 Tax=Saccharobesus litoralis TaxID=2172099 RepID=A0A2S0VVD2_9ALTE|nr:DUF1800 domain-containing protein [Saccharobesus litoralis]AWB68169.1 DUF1800 domain-containing protein [Saccharobesus litoralis]
MSVQAAIATNRFAYGARPGDLNAAQADPKQWLIRQLINIPAPQGLATSDDIAQQFAVYREMKKREKDQANGKQVKLKKSQVQNMMQDMEYQKNFERSVFFDLTKDTFNQALESDNSLAWRLLDFFSNHFSVSASGRLMRGLAPTLEREAIGPNLVGKFEDMLLAVAQHPAMLIYLNNEQSFGENSKLGRRRKKGLNENLAREILELHTLGVDGGYSQADVIELAKAITGWSVAVPNRQEGTGFKFRDNGHEPGTRRLLGKRYAQQGVSQGKAMLLDLARHANTAQYVCFKLARHFVADTPDPQLVSVMQKTWLRTQGDIKQVMITLINHDAAWLEQAQKFKTPREFVISGLRALNARDLKDKHIVYMLDQLGQRPFNAGSPAGYSDQQADWDGASALMARIDWASMQASQRRKQNAKQLVKNSLGEWASESTSTWISRAESHQQGIAMLLMSPEFQRR